MVDQNNIGTQSNQQVVMWWNPFDLIDNKDVQAQENVQTNQQQNQEVVQNIPVEQIEQNPVVDQNVVNQQNAPVQQNVPVQQKPVVEEKWPSGFMKWLIKFIAKVSGQPDPETGKSEKKTNQNTTISQNNQNWAVQPVQKSWNAFDNIMGGVTGFLDKVEKKVEKASGVDLNSLGNMPKKEDVTQQPVEPSQPVEVVQQPQSVQAVQAVQQTGNWQVPVSQNAPVQQNSVWQVPQDVSQVNTEETKVCDNVVKTPEQTAPIQNNQVVEKNMPPVQDNPVVGEEKKEENLPNQ
jgi:hypothetical protein